MKHLLVTSALALVAGTASAASPLVYGGTAAGNQAYAEMLGLDFHVNSAITFTQIGVFDDGMNGLSTTLMVGLYDMADWSAVVAPVTFASGTPSSGSQFVLKSIAPVTLQAGHDYSLQAIGFDASNLNFNTNVVGPNNGSNNDTTAPITFNTFGGALSNLNTRFAGGLGQPGISFPNSSTFGSATLAVPEPETYAMLLAGLGALGLLARRRRD